MGKGYKHGVSLNDILNFSVKTYATEAELLADQAPENTIGIVTTVTLKGWIISDEAPNPPVSGTLWIMTGDKTDHAFNALKENEIKICPLAVRRRLGAWLYVPAFFRRDGEWEFWWNGELYWYGSDVTRITGGWKSVADAGSTTMNAKAPTLTKYSTYMNIKQTGYNGRGYIAPNNPVDLTDYSQLEITVSSTSIKGTASSVVLEVLNEAGSVVSTQKITAAGTFDYDISGLTGNHYLRIMVTAASYNTVTFRVQYLLLR